ncbi:hypothetical protein BV22DRAFT_577295 [Leucogyrophana mollusca]|uniref:Uncharacterized protein n=1 Tax=Leucogyrophana mollusca TaxID=85980 RepID=A0ACB8BFE5_9AGAM|nr:hypothetical protein BV22DRAFT_577295 [Leucogyrophana mollusca]
MSTTVAEEKGTPSSIQNSLSQRKETPITFERPKGWRGIYYHPVTQLMVLGFVCFLCPGMLNALTGLGGGGQVNATTSANSTCVLNSTYAVFGFFFGTVNNMIGAKRTLVLGTLGYVLYIGSFLATKIHPGVSGAGDFVVFSSAILGVTAAFLWTAQGSLMLSYATEAQKGIYIGIFLAIYNLGAVVGSAVFFGQNFHLTDNSVGNGVYIGFMILTIMGIGVSMLMGDPEKMIRTDGTKVFIARRSSWKSKICGTWVAIVTDPLILLLFPMFFASNWFYTWQFNDYNFALFNLRAQALNNLVSGLSQIFGSVLIGGLVLDQKRLRRRTRAFTGWFVLLAMTFIVHIWSYFYQRTYTRWAILPYSRKIDIYDSEYPAHIWLMIFYGLLDAMWQTTAMWLIGAMSNDINKLAIFSGFYHSIQTAGTAGAWRMDAIGMPYMTILLSAWGLLVGSLVLAFPMIYLRVKDHTAVGDETLIQLGEPASKVETEVEAI